MALMLAGLHSFYADRVPVKNNECTTDGQHKADISGVSHEGSWFTLGRGSWRSWNNGYCHEIRLATYQIGNGPASDGMLIIQMTSSNGNYFRVTGLLRGEFTGHRWIPLKRPVTRSFDVFFDLHLTDRLSKQSWGRWFERPSYSSWRRCNELGQWLLPRNMIIYILNCKWAGVGRNAEHT